MMTILDPSLVSAPLSVAMREGSAAAHTAAENSGFVTDLMSGKVNALGYRDLLLRLREVYAHLETMGRALADNDAVAAVLDADLERLPALESDLLFWSDRAGEPVPATFESPATSAYVDALVATRVWPPLLLAHHYTRYLGDLSGGQAIGRVLDREFDLQGHGIAFYTFTAVPKPKPYKDNYRAKVDALEFSIADRQRIVDEVGRAFAFNQGLFAELAENMDEYRR